MSSLFDQEVCLMCNGENSLSCHSCGGYGVHFTLNDTVARSLLLRPVSMVEVALYLYLCALDDAFNWQRWQNAADEAMRNLPAKGDSEK